MDPTIAASSPDIWPILWPVIVGGLLTLLPAIAGQVITHVLAQSAAKEVRRRDRFERLATAIAEYDVWQNKRLNSKAYAETDPGPSPLPNIFAIATMDFQDLLPALDEMEAQAIHYELWQNHAAMRRLEGKIDKINDGFDEAYPPFLAKYKAVIKQLRSIGLAIGK